MSDESFAKKQVEPTGETLAGLLTALLSTASALAIRFDVEEAAFMRIVGGAFNEARTETAAVDAEDGN